MKITFAQVLKKYPLKPSRIAQQFNRSREWIMHLANNPMGKPETIEANLTILEEYLVNLGAELSNITLSAQPQPGAVTVFDFFQEYPFTTAGMAKYMGRSREWLSLIVFDRYKFSPKARDKHILEIQEVLRDIGKDLAKLKIIQK